MTADWPAWELRGHGSAAPPRKGAADHPEGDRPLEPVGAAPSGLDPLEPWVSARLTFPDGARIDVLVTVEDDGITVEDLRADPPLSLSGLATLAHWIEGPLDDACRIATGRARRPRPVPAPTADPTATSGPRDGGARGSGGPGRREVLCGATPPAGAGPPADSGAPSTGPEADPATDRATDRPVGRTTDRATDRTMGPTTDRATGLTTDRAADPAAEPAPAQATDRAAEAATAPATVPTAEPETAPAAGLAAEPAAATGPSAAPPGAQAAASHPASPSGPGSRSDQAAAPDTESSAAPDTAGPDLETPHATGPDPSDDRSDATAAVAEPAVPEGRTLRGRGGDRSKAVADAYREAQRDGRDPVEAVMSATGRGRRRALRLIAGARDAGLLSPRHHRR